MAKKKKEMKLEIILLIAMPLVLGFIFLKLNGVFDKKEVKKYVLEYSSFTDNEIYFFKLLERYKADLLNISEQTFTLVLKTYSTDKYATELARAHSVDMMNDKHVSHFLFTERVKELLSRGAKSYNEIVGMASSVESLFNKFLNSPDHKAVIDNPRYNAIGIGITYKPSIYYATIIFFEV